MDIICFVAFDRTMRDLMRMKGDENFNKVIRKGSRLDVMAATINSYSSAELQCFKVDKKHVIEW